MSLSNQKLKIVLLILFFFGIKSSFSQVVSESGNSKSIIVGVATVAVNPYFLNVLPKIGYRTYNSNKNRGFGVDAEYLQRFRLDNFKILLLDFKAYKKLNTQKKNPLDVGISVGVGANTAPKLFFLASAFVGIPIWKLHLELQPTVVLPNIKSSFLNLSLAYHFKLKGKAE